VTQLNSRQPVLLKCIWTSFKSVIKFSYTAYLWPIAPISSVVGGDVTTRLGLSAVGNGLFTFSGSSSFVVWPLH
jgi:hypothetical protein